MRALIQMIPRLFAAGLLLAACGTPEAAVPDVALGPALCAAEVSAEPSAVLLTRGRIALTIAGEARVQVLDSLCAVTSTLGRAGAGPGEFRFVARAFVDTAGGLHVLDPELQRLTHYDSAGAHLGATPMSGPASIASLVRAPDGHLFWTEPLPAVEDSVALFMQGDQGASGGAQIARLLKPAPVLVPLGDVAINTPPEYAAFDAWGALDNGRVWIARGGDNRLEVAGGASSMTGPSVPFARIETVPSDRDRWRGLPAPERFRVPTRPLAPIKGPFQGVLRAPDGEFWLWLNQPAGHTSEWYACRTIASQVLLRITVPNAHKVLAVGTDRVYLYGENAEGLPTLSMHSRPDCSS